MLLMDDPKTDPWLTRVSLLARVKNLDDAASWQEFFETYQVMVRKMAQSRGLRDHEADEVAQEVFKRIATTIGDFERAPHRGAFRSWLFRLTRWRADDHRDARTTVESRRETRVDAGDGPGALHQIAAEGIDPFEAEARRNLVETLLKRVSHRLSAKDLQVFQLHVLDEKPVEEVARLLRVTATVVYNVKHRVVKLMREEVDRFPIERP